MSRRIQAAAAVIFAFAPAAFADGDRACTRDTLLRLPAQRPALAALFDRGADSVETDTGVTARTGATEVVLARIDANGKVILACVDSEAAARAFLDSEIDGVMTPHAREK